MFVTDRLDDIGANGMALSADDPSRLARSHVENGAVTGDSVSRIRQPAAIFVSIGQKCVQQKKRHAAHDLM